MRGCYFFSDMIGYRNFRILSSGQFGQRMIQFLWFRRRTRLAFRRYWEFPWFLLFDRRSLLWLRRDSLLLAARFQSSLLFEFLLDTCSLLSSLYG